MTDRPLVELQFLGSLAARQGALDLTASIAQPKRLALLAWLELSRPYGLHPRDTLSGLLWPESPNDKARTALRQLLLVLRRDLGDDVFVMEGELLGINRDRVTSDAGMTLDALERGDDEQALSRYSGDLLPGLPFAEGEYFERWFEQRRAELKRAVVLAAWRLVDRAEAREDLHAARRYAERAFAIDGEDEAGLRRVMALQARTGDRSAAQRSYEIYARRIREDWATDPETFTQELLDRIRSGGLSGDREAFRPPNLLSPVSPSAEPTATKVLPRRRLTRVVLSSLVIIAGIAAAASRWSARHQKVERLAVLPFENGTGSPEYDQLGMMAADWVARGLVDARLAEVVPNTVVTQAVAEALAARQDVIGTLQDLAGATKVVTGAFYRVGDSLRFQVEVVDTRSEQSIATIRPATALASGAMVAIDSVRHRVLGATAELLNARDGWSTGVAPPPSLEMYRLYLRTEAAWRAGRWDEMEQLARLAYSLDSTHANAGISLVQALQALGRTTEADSLLRRLESLPNLGPGDALSVSLMRTFLDGDIEAMHRLYAANALVIGDGNTRVQMAQDELNLNRPREALRHYNRVNWRLAEVAETPARWQIAPTAHHLLGSHREELKQARAIRKRFPKVFWLLELEAAPLAVLGRETDLQRVKVDARALESAGNDGPGNYGELLLTIAADQHWHRDSLKGVETAREATAWFESRPASEAGQRRWRYASALWLAGRGSEVRRLLPPECSLTEWECYAWRGIMAVSGGDTLTAREVLKVIEGMGQQPRSERGWRALGRAAIAASLGESRHSVEYLREAVSRGIPVWSLHWTFAAFFLQLRTDVGFQEFMRPKG